MPPCNRLGFLSSDLVEAGFRHISTDQFRVTVDQKDEWTENCNLESIPEHLHIGEIEEEQAKLGTCFAQYMGVFYFQDEDLKSM